MKYEEVKLNYLFDGDLPAAIDFHTALLKRATYKIPEVRPPIISEETFAQLNMLRAYRHKLRRIYTYLISADKVVNLIDTAINSMSLFSKDWGIFKKYLLRKA